MSLGARLKSLRIGKGESLQEAADGIGISKPHLWELETGKSTNPTLELLNNLARHYHTTLTYLAGKTGEAEVETMVFGREFNNATDREKKLILEMTEKVLGKQKRG